MAKMGGARVFFTLLADMQVDKLVSDSRAAANIMQTVYIDAIDGVLESMTELFGTWAEFSEEVASIAEPVEIARIHMNKFLDETDDKIAEIHDSIVSMGQVFNVAADDALEASAKMMQLQPVLGSTEAAMGATTGSMLMSAVGMMSGEQAMNDIMRLQMQTGFMYGGVDRDMMSASQQGQMTLGRTIELVDMLNEAENKTGATIQGVTMSMSHYAASAQLANMEMSEQIALSASLIEQGEEQGKSGRALKMILARLASDRSKNNALLEEHGVLVKDEYGNMKPLLQIMGELKTQTDASGRSWDQLNGVEKQNIAIAVAGSHHYVRFLKLMEAYDRTLQIQTDVQNSAGSAMEEFGNFTENSAFQLQRLNNAIEYEQALLGQALIPSMKHAANVELLFMKTRNSLLDTYGGTRFSMFMNTSNVVMEQAGSFMQLMFMARVLTLAMKTLNIVRQQGLQGMGMTEKARRVEIEQLKMSSVARREYADAYMKGATIESLVDRQKYSRLQIEHALNESLVARLRLYHQTMSTSQIVDVQALRMSSNISQAKMRELLVSKVLSEQEIKNRLADQAAAEMKMARIQVEQAEIAARLKLGTSLNEQELRSLNMQQARLRAEHAIQRVTIARVKHEATMNNMILQLTNQDLDAKNRAILLTRIQTEQDEHRIKVQEIMATSKASNIRLDQTATAGVIANARATNVNTTATMNNAKMSTTAARAKMMFNASINHGTSALMLASMATSFVGDEQTAAAASAGLMTAAMIPMTISMITYGRAADKAAFSTTVATLGFAAVAGGAAYLIAKNSKAVNQFDKEMEAMEEELKKSKDAMSALEKEFESFGDTNGAMWADAANNTSSSIDSMTQDMKEFSDMRQELFFGGKAGRMDQALFNEVKQNGVEKLFYAPEIHMTNTFNGLTYHAAAEMIADLVEERAERRSRQSVTGF